MFDKIYPERKSTKLAPYEKTVNINNAPSIESVRLLKDLEREAMERVINVFHFKSLEVEGVVLEKYSNDYKSSVEYICIFDINGNRRQVVIPLEDPINPQKRVNNFKEKIGEEIKNYILSKLMYDFMVIEHQVKAVMK